jgi:hypothetical protein
MGGLPLELLTMLFSTVLGGVMSIWGQSIKAKEARDAGKNDKHFAWTRRLIALSAVFAIIVLPKLVAVVYPEVPVFVGYSQATGGGFFGLFGAEKDVIHWQMARGFVITPLDTHIVSAIVGLYFGAGFTK